MRRIFPCLIVSSADAHRTDNGEWRKETRFRNKTQNL